jgi:hypothetical protein
MIDRRASIWRTSCSYKSSYPLDLSECPQYRRWLADYCDATKRRDGPSAAVHNSALLPLAPARPRFWEPNERRLLLRLRSRLEKIFGPWLELSGFFAAAAILRTSSFKRRLRKAWLLCLCDELTRPILACQSAARLWHSYGCDAEQVDRNLGARHGA